LDAILTVAISTIGDRFLGISTNNLPQSDLWKYIVLHQHNTQQHVDYFGSRDDISIASVDGIGVSESRNAALSLCQTELLLFFDDDTGVCADGLRSIVRIFTEKHDLCLLAGMTLSGQNPDARRYPATARELTLFNSAHIGTVELSVRVDRIRASGVRFDPHFGAGTVNFLGDEYIFVADCLKAGLRGRYEPIAVAMHTEPSSGLDFSSEAATRARAKVFERVFGRVLAWPIKVGFLIRHRHRFSGYPALWLFARRFLFGIS
jgi:hypothetical protein